MFWVLYYIFFSIIWANDQNYFESFFLEFILLPIRAGAVYTTIYILIPKSILTKKYVRFCLHYGSLLVLCGLLQRVFLFFFYEHFTLQSGQEIFDTTAVLRAMILINSTVLFVSAIKMVQLWHHEHDQNLRLQSSHHNDLIEIKSDKRLFRVRKDDILFVEGLGNYVIYHLDDQKLISYTSLKEVMELLPNNFIRIHKSYVVNKDQIKSYNQESIEINQTFLPIGRAFKPILNI